MLVREVVVFFIPFLLLIIDGQKIAKKLCKGITKETCTARKLLDALNTSLSQADETFVPLALADVLSPVSEFWQCPNQASSEIPVSIKRDIIEAHLLLKRCDEELLLLQTEMHNVIDYYNEKEKKIISVLHKITSDGTSQFHRGCISLLRKLQLEVELFRSIAVSAYASVITVPKSHPLVDAGHMCVIDASDSSDSEYESSSDGE